MSSIVSSVYVHAPFCARRCTYCDFAVSVAREGDLVGWRDAIVGELSGIRDEGLFELGETLDTLYVGGGTPSLLGAPAMGMLKTALGAERFTDDLEWTAEANPESMTDDLAEAWGAAGVNRLSLGAQTFHDDSLRWMGRLHGSDGPARAVTHARAAGITNVSVDLIFGLPARLGRDWEADLEAALELSVPHVSLYGLTVEKGTALGRAVAEGRETQADEDQYRAEYLLAAEKLTAAGYRHYEVSNFARPGFESRHNAVYWSGDAYLGLGNGAHSYAPPVRRWNERSWESYRDVARQGRVPEAGREEVDAVGRSLEAVWLGLRTDLGVSVEELRPDQRSAVERWNTMGWLESIEPRVRLNAEGWLLLDRLAVELDAASG